MHATMRRPEIYEEIGGSYTATRREDSRIGAQIWDAIGDGRSVVNVGAGTGSYEPTGCDVIAVEPSSTMLSQRSPQSSPAVRAVAERLPFDDDTFDVAMAVLTIHHWTDPIVGLRELRRVSGRQVIFYFEPLRTHSFWGLEYFPEAAQVASEHDAPGEETLAKALDLSEIRPVLVPADCRDGFGVAFWARPEAYTDPVVQAGMSWLALLPDQDRARGTARLADDLATGEWDRRYGHLRQQDTYDGGYRIAIAGR